MFPRVIFAIALLAAGSAAYGSAPVRYVPAPPGKIYYMLNGGGAGIGGTYKTSESVEIAGHPVAGKHTVTSEWTNVTSEIGIAVGYGLGRAWFLPSVDVSAYVPLLCVRSFQLNRYRVTSDPANVQAEFAMATLHPSLTTAAAGTGIGDSTLSAMALLYGDNASGTWISSTVRLTLGTGGSAYRQFVRILHGDVAKPAPGEGVSRVVPAVAILKMLGGQRVYLDAEYALPMASKESFSFTPGFLVAPNNLPFDDSNKVMDEVFKPGGVVFGTLGVETSMNLFGVVPGVEMNVRSWQAATWTENGTDPLKTPSSTSGYPTHTPAFLTDAAWVMGSLPLKANTEIEVALVGTARFGGGNVLKAGLSYISGSYGNSLGFRVTFVSLFTEKALSERGVPGKPEAREIEVAPVLDAPLAPSVLVKTGVSFPMFGAGISQEEAGWVAGQLRAGMGRLRQYDVMKEKDMEQLAFEPCGDADCGTRYARALKLQAYVVSRLEKAGSGFALGVAMINVADGTVAASDSVSAASLEELRGQIPVMLGRLTKPPAPAAVR
ncbi:MAG: hypothetical protein AAB152_00205 [Candidatus Coatesbacteria bacterium]